MNYYYYQHIPDAPASIVLDEEESFHAATTRRQRNGDQVALIDGRGKWAVGVIHGVTRSAVSVRIQSCSRIEKRWPDLILACALPKGDRLRTMLSMIAQIGVATFVPLECERSVVKPGGAVNVERWARIFRESCKQSHNPFLPTIERATSPIDYVSRMLLERVPVLIADQSGVGVPTMSRPTAVVLCVGPEGGFSEAEKEAMLAAGAKRLGLGANVLRIETAAVVAVSIVHHQLRTEPPLHQ